MHGQLCKPQTVLVIHIGHRLVACQPLQLVHMLNRYTISRNRGGHDQLVEQ